MVSYWLVIGILIIVVILGIYEIIKEEDEYSMKLSIIFMFVALLLLLIIFEQGEIKMIKKLKSKRDMSDLTIGKEYYILEEINDKYEILDDVGDIIQIDKYRFEQNNYLTDWS